MLGREVFDLDGLPLEELRYVTYAERFGWTPEQVDAVPAKKEMWFIPILNVIDHVRREKQGD